MVANWTLLISELRSKALTHGVVIPEHPTADGRWHQCGLIKGKRKGGAYLLFEHLPHVALYASNRADRRAPEVWRPDGDRLLPYGNEPRVAAALALFSAVTVLGPIEDPSSRPCLSPAGGRASARHSPRQAATRLLETLLANGALYVRELRARAQDAGISWASIRRAAISLGVVATRKGFGQDGAWHRCSIAGRHGSSQSTTRSRQGCLRLQEAENNKATSDGLREQTTLANARARAVSG